MSFVQSMTKFVLEELHNLSDELYRDLDGAITTMEEKKDRSAEQLVLFHESSKVFKHCYNILKVKMPDLENNLQKEKKEELSELYSRVTSLSWISDYAKAEDLTFHSGELAKLKEAINLLKKLLEMLDYEIQDILCGHDTDETDEQIYPGNKEFKLALKSVFQNRREDFEALFRAVYKKVFRLKKSEAVNETNYALYGANMLQYVVIHRDETMDRLQKQPELLEQVTQHIKQQKSYSKK